MRADDGVPAVHVILAIEEMHGAAEPARTAGRFPEKLRHAGVGARSAGQRVRMVAIGRDDVIVVPRGGDRADRRLLPVRYKDGRSRRFSAPDIVDSRVPQNAGSTASARAFRLRRVAPAAACAVRRARKRGCRAGTCRRCGRSSCKGQKQR